MFRFPNLNLDIRSFEIQNIYYPTLGQDLNPLGC